MEKHSSFGPSSAARWTVCTKSITLEKEIDYKYIGDKSYSEMGSKLHDIAEKMLKGDLDTIVEKELMVKVRPYVEYVKSINTPNSTMFIEKRVDYSFIDADNTENDKFGTADCIIIDDDTLHVIDLKTGFVTVEAVNNLQLLLYAIGAVNEFSSYNFKNIRLHVCQTTLDGGMNIDYWDLERDVLKNEWEQKFKNSINEIKQGGVYRPGIDQCKYCKVVGSCPAVKDTIINKYKEIMDKEEIKVTDEDRKWVLDNFKLLKLFHSAVEMEVKDKLKDGGIFEGYVLANSPGRRKIGDFEESALFENYGENIYTKSLKGILELEKLIGKDELSKYTEVVQGQEVLKKIV